MPHYKLKSTLQDQLTRIKESDECRSLAEEVAVARLTVQRALDLYSTALADQETDAGTEELARSILKDGLRLVQDLLGAQAKLETLMSPFDAATLVKRIEQVVHRHLRNDQETFDRICEDLRSLDLSKQGHAQIQVVID